MVLGNCNAREGTVHKVQWGDGERNTLWRLASAGLPAGEPIDSTNAESDGEGEMEGWSALAEDILPIFLFAKLATS